MRIVDGFAGTWAYRSLDNVTDLATPMQDVLIAAGDLTLEVGKAGAITGHLAFHGYDAGLAFTGTATASHPPSIRLRATGFEGTFTAGWVYDYVGYLMPTWPDGVEQRPTVVGSMVRVADRLKPDGTVEWPKGEVVSFLALSEATS